MEVAVKPMALEHITNKTPHTGQGMTGNFHFLLVVADGMVTV
jgi:hypothetical protein